MGQRGVVGGDTEVDAWAKGCVFIRFTAVGRTRMRGNISCIFIILMEEIAGESPKKI